jgi:mono/diheme cytochrome c family protein
MPPPFSRLVPRPPRRRLALAAAAAALCACDSQQVALSPLAEQGRRVYLNVCVACHNGDPNEDGAVGPANAGASRELLEAKVLHGTYPPGYAPKRESNAMPRFEYLAGDIDALHAYLQESRR